MYPNQRGIDEADTFWIPEVTGNKWNFCLNEILEYYRVLWNIPSYIGNISKSRMNAILNRRNKKFDVRDVKLSCDYIVHKRLKV